ncbi:hypothetical protein FQR65_LT19572 [Abscondita terminalis]|nr:hypothetical protein FQR65_LT19572 [Abscondita terminalis]
MLNNRLRNWLKSNNPPFTYGYYTRKTYARSKEAFQGFACHKGWPDQDQCLKILLEEVERTRDFGFTQTELERAKAQVLSNLERSYNNRDKTESGMLVDEYGKDPKSMVTISYGGEAPYSEKEALSLSALGEVATIKIIEKLREDESGIYGGGARGGMSKVPYGAYSFGISFPCGPENAEKLTKS